MDSSVAGTIVRGHRVASGQNRNPRFPGGTIRMQAPHFLARGLDISPFYPGTLNMSIAPCRYRVMQPRVTLRGVAWHPTDPAEDFSFFDVQLRIEDFTSVNGLIYFPHPDTKPTHFQEPDVLELLLPWIEGLTYGMRVGLEVPSDQMRFEC